MKRCLIYPLVICMFVFFFIGFAQADRHAIVGTWRLVTIVDPNPRPDWVDVKPSGYIMYDSTGHMAVQMTRRHDRIKFKSPNRAKGTPEEIKDAFLSYGAYYGTYDINEKEGLIIHNVEGNLFPNSVGMKYRRFYELSGDRLILMPASMVGGKLAPRPETSTVRHLIWERVK